MFAAAGDRGFRGKPQRRAVFPDGRRADAAWLASAAKSGSKAGCFCANA